MSFEIKHTVHEVYLRVDATGKWSTPEVFEFIDSVKRIADEADRKSVLMDLREVDGTPSGADLFLAGERIAQTSGSRIKAAAFERPDRITKLGGLSAVNRGAGFLVTDSESEAIEWLLSDEQ